jgi:hypothetical protein
VLALIALVAEALFLGATAFLPQEHVIWGMVTCAVILLVTILGITVVEYTKERAATAGGALKPSPLTPSSDILNQIINSSIETVCRAVSLPETPQSAKLRVFIFRKMEDQLMCTHFWSQDPVKEAVGKLRFNLNRDVAEKVAVVRAAMDQRICRTEVEPIARDLVADGDVEDDLNFVLAAPILKEDGSVWGTVDFDAATDAGRALLSNEVSNAVMFQLAQHLRVIFSLSEPESEHVA